MCCLESLLAMLAGEVCAARGLPPGCRPFVKVLYVEPSGPSRGPAADASAAAQCNMLFRCKTAVHETEAADVDAFEQGHGRGDEDTVSWRRGAFSCELLPRVPDAGGESGDTAAAPSRGGLSLRQQRPTSRQQSLPGRGAGRGARAATAHAASVRLHLHLRKRLLAASRLRLTQRMAGGALLPPPFSPSGLCAALEGAFADFDWWLRAHAKPTRGAPQPPPPPLDSCEDGSKEADGDRGGGEGVQYEADDGLERIGGGDDLDGDECSAAAVAAAVDEASLGGGTTALVCVAWQQQLHLASLGDSRAVLATAGRPAVRLTVDHTPALPSEAQRILDAGSPPSPALHRLPPPPFRRLPFPFRCLPRPSVAGLPTRPSAAALPLCRRSPVA